MPFSGIIFFKNNSTLKCKILKTVSIDLKIVGRIY